MQYINYQISERKCERHFQWTKSTHFSSSIVINCLLWNVETFMEISSGSSNESHIYGICQGMRSTFRPKLSHQIIEVITEIVKISTAMKSTLIKFVLNYFFVLFCFFSSLTYPHGAHTIDFSSLSLVSPS